MGRGCPGRRAKGANALLVITLSSVLLVKGLESSTDFGLQCDFLHPFPHRIESWDVPITKHIPGAAAWAHCGVLGPWFPGHTAGLDDGEGFAILPLSRWHMLAPLLLQAPPGPGAGALPCSTCAAGTDISKDPG